MLMKTISRGSSKTKIMLMVFLGLLITLSTINVGQVYGRQIEGNDRKARVELSPWGSNIRTKPEEMHGTELDVDIKVSFPNGGANDVDKIRYIAQYNLHNMGGDNNIKPQNRMKEATLDSNGELKTSVKMKHVGRYPTERLTIYVYVYYKDGSYEQHGSAVTSLYSINAPTTVKVKDHPKGIEVKKGEHSDIKIDKEFEFVPTWKEDTKFSVEAPSHMNLTESYPAGATPESSSQLTGYRQEKNLDYDGVLDTVFRYEDLGTYKGKTVAMEGRVVGYKERPNMDINYALMSYGSRDYVSVEHYQYHNVEHEWKFYDQDTGLPLKISGYFTFVDLDGYQGMMIKKETMEHVVNIYATDNASARLSDEPDGTYIYSNSNGDLDPIDEEGWFTVTLRDMDTFKFAWGGDHANRTGGGYVGFLDETTPRVELADPYQYVWDEEEELLEEYYEKIKPVRPTLKFVTTHNLGKTAFKAPKPTRYEIYANIPTELKVNNVRVTSENRDVTHKFRFYERDNDGRVTVKMRDQFLGLDSSYGTNYRLEIETEVIKDIEELKDEDGYLRLEYEVDGGVLREQPKIGVEEGYSGIATGVLLYDEEIPPPTTNEMAYTIKHLDLDNEEVSGTEKGTLKLNETKGAKAHSIVGYTYTGRYSVDGKEENGSSYNIEFKRNKEAKEVIFIYKKIDDEEEEEEEMDYEVRHIDKDTRSVIQTDAGGVVKEGESKVVSSTILTDYTYTGSFRNDGKIGYGDSTRVTFEKGKGKKVVEFLYDANTTPFIVKHVNISTGDSITGIRTGVVRKNSPVSAYSKTIGNYEYTGSYSYNGVSNSGNSTSMVYDRNKERIEVTFYYKIKPPVTGGSYTSRHRSIPTGSLISYNDSGYLWPGQGRTLYRRSYIYGYNYTGRYNHNGSTKYANSQYVSKRSLTEEEIEDGVTDVYSYDSLTFYYDYKEMPYKVEHRNIESNNLIAYGSESSVNIGNSATVNPISVEGYRYTGQYDHKGQRRFGNSSKIEYEEGGGVTVVFYYQWEKPDVTTKDFDTTDALEMYTNVGLVTERDDTNREIRGHNDEEFGQDVISTRVNANSSAVLDKYKSPLAIEPRVMKLRVDENGGSNTETSVAGGYAILNTDYLDSLRVRRTIGGGSGGQTSINLVNRGDYADMEKGKIGSILGARNTALGSSGASLDSTEETSYAGRWLGIDRTVYDLDTWNDVNSLSLNIEHVKTENRNLDKVTTELDYKVHNVLEHKYVPVSGWNGIEYYVYESSVLLPGTSSGSGNTSNKTYKYSANVDLSEMKLEKTFKASDLKSQTSTSRNLVAREQFNTNGKRVTGHSTSTERVEGSGKNPITSGKGSRNENYAEVTEIDYYEEFGYVPYADSSTNLMTQQAVPVGGKITYVNPYDYFGFPSSVVNTFTGRGSAVDSNYDRGSVNRDEVLKYLENKVENIKNNGLETSVMPYNVTNSGFYVDEIDQFDKFKEELIEDFEEDKNYMSSELGLSDSDIYNYKQPIRFDLGMSHLRLRDKVLVGRMTGYPIVISAQDELDLIKNTQDKETRKDAATRNYSYMYENIYEREFGYKPTKYDKSLSGDGRVTYYYLPLEKEDIRLNDSYNSRMVVNGIGLSQFNLVEDHTYSFDKFLYGRGEDVIFSGERDEFTSFEEEAGLGNESIYEQREYVPQIIKQGKEGKETEQINGVRTRNNSMINKELLED